MGTLLWLGVLALLIRLWVLVGRLTRRVVDLERRLAREVRPVPQPETDAAAEPSPAAPERPAAASSASPSGIWAPARAERPQDPAAVAGPLVERPRSPAGQGSSPAPTPWMEVLLPWVQANWIYLVSAVSLGLAGIFLVQYGAQQGLLTPGLRILAALLLGGCLVAAGEVIRRRWGDEGGTSTAVLPSTLSAAGIVVLYAAILAARSLYGLIGPETTIAALVAVSAVALVFGWFYGPFLAAAGLTGAAAAPFLVGGSSESPALLFGYFGLLGTAGLAIDAMRRWGWVSVLALALAYVAAATVHAALPGFGGFVALLLWLALAAVAIPRLELWPSHPGPSILEAAAERGRESRRRPIAPTWIAGGSVAASSALILLGSLGVGADGQLLALLSLAALALVLTLWTERAEGLADLALVPAGLFLLFTVLTAAGELPVFAEFRGPAGVAGEGGPPRWTATLLLAAAALVSVAAFRRSFRGRWPAAWAVAAAVFAPVAAAALELSWQPARVIGAWPWALHAMALAALMTAFAGRYAAADAPDRRRAAYAALSALSLVALALFVLLSEAALTVALSALVVVAAGLDRRFRLPEMGWFILAGIAALGWRLTVDPGLPAYLGPAPLAEVLLAFGAALLGLCAARAGLPESRGRVRSALEGAILATSGVFASVLVWRGVQALTPQGDDLTHWSASLLGLIWTALAVAQGHRAHLGGPLAGLRRALALGEAGLAALAFLAALTALNPALVQWERVLGPWPLDTLLLAYGLPAAVFAVLARRAGWIPHRGALTWAAAGFGALWAFLAIRRFWQPELALEAGFIQPELYTYTVALLLAGGLLLYQALARNSAVLRRLALGVIGVAIAKVFLVDAGELTGLLRVFSFLALGLVLAGLAWLNRWAGARQTGAAGP